MQEIKKHFQITYNLSLVDVIKETNGEDELFELHFSNEIPPVTLVAKKSSTGQYIWDTIPPGNSELAYSLGKLIEEHHV